MNDPKFSKINWTAFVAFLSSLVVAFGLVPEDQKELVLQGLATLPPIVIMVWRTWFTDKTPKE